MSKNNLPLPIIAGGVAFALWKTIKAESYSSEIRYKVEIIWMLKQTNESLFAEVRRAYAQQNDPSKATYMADNIEFWARDGSF